MKLPSSLAQKTLIAGVFWLLAASAGANQIPPQGPDDPPVFIGDLIADGYRCHPDGPGFAMCVGRDGDIWECRLDDGRCQPVKPNDRDRLGAGLLESIEGIDAFNTL